MVKYHGDRDDDEGRKQLEKKKAAAAAVATVISASGVAVDATFDNPAEILQTASVEPQVQSIDGDMATDEDAVQEDEEKQKTTAKGTFKEWILGLPIMVRAVFVLPAWLIGTGIMAAGEFLFTALSPFAHWILSFLLLALVIAAAFTITAKAMFPDLPLRKILNKHSIKWIVIVSIVAFAADLMLGVLWVEYTRYKTLVIAGLILLSLGSLMLWFSRREKRRREKEALNVDAVEADDEPEELVFTSLGETFTVRPSAEKVER